MTELDDHLHREFAAVRERVANLPLAPLADRRPARRRVPRPLATVIAFAVVVVIVLAAISLTSSSTHEPTATTPTTVAPVPSAPPIAGFLTLPYPGNKHTVDVWNWAGRRIATVHTAGVADCCTTVSLSPDGTRILVEGVTGSAMPHSQVLDLHGRVLAQGDFDGMWADDSRHLCNMQTPAGTHGYYDGPTRLVLIDPGHGSRTVARVGDDGPHAGPVIYECSVVRDEALVGMNVMALTRGPLWRVQLSTGRVSSTTWASPTSFDITAVSGNGRYALVEPGGGGPTSAVVDTETGRTVATVDGQPQDISWNGRLITVNVNDADLEVVDWNTHKVLWRSGHQTGNGPTLFTGAEMHARPHSDDLALDVRDVVGQSLDAGALWLIKPGAQPRLIASPVVEGIG